MPDDKSVFNAAEKLLTNVAIDDEGYEVGNLSSGSTFWPMAVPARLSREEIIEMSRELPPPISDDVSITSDGVRLDSKAKVLAFLAEIERERREGRISPHVI